jgi:hypothetical protein|tara:strand:- start:718 stop:897 length:180 start_codon:yes stop_codon:yes gene_type:complete
MDKEDKLLLTQSVDLMISTVSSQLPKVQEEERLQGRELISKLLVLTNKIAEIKENLEIE